MQGLERGGLWVVRSDGLKRGVLTSASELVQHLGEVAALHDQAEAAMGERDPRHLWLPGRPSLAAADMALAQAEERVVDVRRLFGDGPLTDAGEAAISSTLERRAMINPFLAWSRTTSTFTRRERGPIGMDLARADCALAITTFREAAAAALADEHRRLLESSRPD